MTGAKKGLSSELRGRIRRLALFIPFILFLFSGSIAFAKDPDGMGLDHLAVTEPTAEAPPAAEATPEAAVPLTEPLPQAEVTPPTAATPESLPQAEVAPTIANAAPNAVTAPIAAVPPAETMPPAQSTAPAETQPTSPPILATPALIVSSGILVDGLQYDFPMPWGNAEFEKIRASYLTSGGKKWLEAVMRRSIPYLSYVEEKVEEMGLPWELVFLPVIESEYSPFAVSRSGATGIWQFMRNSISGYGIAISDWKDERKDFMKSTDAALAKLLDNYKALGDWPLAIAAYNAGLGAVSRAVKSSTGATIDFWTLYESKKLSREPLSYVPKFLAISSILRYPELHGLSGEWGERNEWEALATDRQVDLNVLAERCGISIDLLKKGNAELKYNVTPPTNGHMVKVPAGNAEAARAVLNDTSKPLYRYDIHKVKSGDTLGAIASKYSTPLSIILQANPGIKPDRIQIGQTIIIPHLKGTAPSSSTSKSGESLVFNSSYTIKKGDTLWDISLMFDVQPDLLAEKNGITIESVLRIGQKLKVPSR
jgi:membrane-bound lytic murein transglycosylase D